MFGMIRTSMRAINSVSSAQHFTRLTYRRSFASLPITRRTDTLSAKLPMPSLTSQIQQQVRSFSCTKPTEATLNQVIRGCRKKKTSSSNSPNLGGAPQRKGVVLKLFVQKPKKPNSAQRKCARVRLSNGKIVLCFIPGEGHNLQEHAIVLVCGGRVHDCPDIKYRVVRGVYDCQGVHGRSTSRSKYGAKKPKA